MTFVIDGCPRTKKNSLRVLKNRRTGKPFVAQSSGHNAWAEKATWQVRAQLRGAAPLAMAVNMKAIVYRARAVGDLLNYLAAVSDVLEKARAIVNDRLIVRLDGCAMCVDRERPRVEVTLSPVVLWTTYDVTKENS